MKTHRYTEDSTPSEDPKTGPRKTLAKNAKNVMFYHLRGVRAPRTSTDFQPYLIYEDIRVLGSISKASGGAHTHTMQQTHTHKAVTRRVEAKKLLSRRRHSEYSVSVMTSYIIIPLVAFLSLSKTYWQKPKLCCCLFVWLHLFFF